MYHGHAITASANEMSLRSACLCVWDRIYDSTAQSRRYEKRCIWIEPRSSTPLRVVFQILDLLDPQRWLLVLRLAVIGRRGLHRRIAVDANIRLRVRLDIGI